MNNKKQNLNNLYIINLTYNIKLNDTYTKEEIINLMVENWIGYFECHKCGKWDYCKYAQKHPANPNRSIDIRCGIAIDFITNFINTTFNLIEDLNNHQKQAYLNSAYYLTEFVINTEQVIGRFTSKDHIEGWGEYAPSLYGTTTNYVDDYLKKAQKEMKNVPFLNSKRSVLFVEGESEKIFADFFLDIEVVNYGGTGNLTYSKIEYTIKQYQDKGYKVYIQADKDGKTENQNINKVISKGLVTSDNIFCFKYDFETSVPLHILFKLLNEIKKFSDDYEEFKNEYDGKNGIVKYIETKYNISINKPLFAQKICKYIDNSSHQTNLYYDEKFLTTEIGQFWDFLKRKIVH
jgi:DNA-directed RNA polymerase subunit L